MTKLTVVVQEYEGQGAELKHQAAVIQFDQLQLEGYGPFRSACTAHFCFSVAQLLIHNWYSVAQLSMAQRSAAQRNTVQPRCFATCTA